MASYTDPEPASGAELISVSQPLITGNFTYLKESFGKDHNFTSTSNPSPNNPDGYHTVVHFLNQLVNPPATAGVGKTFTVTVAGDQQLVYESGNGLITQLTGPVQPNAVGGYTIIPGAAVIQWGTVTAAFAPGATGTVNFPIVFPTAVFVVLTSTAFTTATPSNSNPATVAYDTATLSTALFNWKFLSASNSYTQFSWIAIGN